MPRNGSNDEKNKNIERNPSNILPGKFAFKHSFYSFITKDTTHSQRCLIYFLPQVNSTLVVIPTCPRFT